MPFRKLFMPYAHAGFYEPERPVGPEHRGQIIFMPGIGATISHAGRILDVVGTFHGHKSKNRGHGEKSEDHFEFLSQGDQKFRMASYALDITLNGLGDGAPFEFASEGGSIEVIRHLRLILGILNPQLKNQVFLAGRSQGGLAAMSYAARYSDILGVVAVNPSSTRTDVIEASLRVGDSGSKGVFTGFETKLHTRAWFAYKYFTSFYGAYDSPSHRSDLETRPPVLVMLSTQDGSYHDQFLPRSVYESQIYGFRDEDPLRRRLELFEYGHDLWVYRNNPVFIPSVQAMAKFFATRLAEPK